MERYSEIIFIISKYINTTTILINLIKNGTNLMDSEISQSYRFVFLFITE